MTQRKINNPTADGAFGIFWDEYHLIEQTPSQPAVPDEETNNTKDGEFKLNIPILFGRKNLYFKGKSVVGNFSFMCYCKK